MNLSYSLGSPVILRPEIAALEPYRQGRAAQPGALKLSANENPYQPLPEVIEAVATAQISRYPDGSAQLLRERLAGEHGVNPRNVHVGAGSVSILYQLAQVTAARADEIIYAWRSFEAYPTLVTVCGAMSVRVPNRSDGGHDLDAFLTRITASTRMILVCSPNNPTSVSVTLTDFIRFIDLVPANILVVLDEAYYEFVTDPQAVNGIPLLDNYPNLVVLRTFSKAYGLAGLRIGYALGNQKVLDACRSSAIPLSVTEAAQLAALAALDHRHAYRKQHLEIIRVRTLLRDELRKQGWLVPEPQGNFVWLPTGEHTIRVADVLEQHGIITRVFPPDGIRITVGDENSLARVLAATAKGVDKLLGDTGKTNEHKDNS